MDVTRFIILSDARTGSNLLHEALAAHPNILCFRELFNLDVGYIDYDVDGYEGSSAEDLDLRASDPEAFLRRRIYAVRDPDILAVGFKFHYGHFWFHERLLPVLTDDSALRVIHLRRINLVRSFVSLKIAEQTGAWFQHDESRRRRRTLVRRLSVANLYEALLHPARAISRIQAFLTPPPPAPSRSAVVCTKDDLDRYFYRVRHDVQHFEKAFSGHPIERLTFEELTGGRDAALRRVYRFLGTPQHTPPGAILRRQNPEPLAELIANYAEIRSAYSGTAEEAWFDD